MGVTIHFEGSLQHERAYSLLVQVVQDFGDRHAWASSPIAESTITLRRVRNEEPCDYTGPTKGIQLAPRENCEPLRFEFDRDLFVQEYVKTQFAGPEVHVAIIELLRALEPFFRDLEVYDEGEYWETSQRSILEAHMSKTAQVLEEHLAADPTLRGPVRLPSGRLADFISGEAPLPPQRKSPWWQFWKRP